MRPSPHLLMRATRVLRSGALDPKNGVYLGTWGNLGSQPQKGVISYALSPNRQKPLAGAMHNAIFNTARRTKDQILYWLPSILLAYAAMQWAMEKNEYYNSKPGRLAEQAAESGSS